MIPDRHSRMWVLPNSSRNPYTSMAKGMEKLPTELTTPNTRPVISGAVSAWIRDWKLVAARMMDALTRRNSTR